jgi:hypothetical protein
MKKASKKELSTPCVGHYKNLASALDKRAKMPNSIKRKRN